MKQAIALNGVLIDVGPNMPTYPDAVPGHDLQAVQVADDAQVGWTWDGQKASPPDPKAGIVEAPTIPPAEKLRAFLVAHPDVITLLGG